MKNLLKILGFIGSIAVGITTVNYLIKSSKSDVSSAVAGQPSAQITKPSTQSKKLSRLAKIEQSYKPKDSEEIPVEYVQIATSDIDEGKKLPVINSSLAASTDKLVKVDQGSPFLSSRSGQATMPTQSDMSQAAYPQDNYYPEYFDNGMGSSARNNQIPSNDVNQSSQQPAQSQGSDTMHEKTQPDERKSHFRSIDDDVASLNTPEYNPGMTSVNSESPNKESMNRQMPAEQSNDVQDNNSAWKNLLNGLSNSLGSFIGYKGLDWLFNKLKDKVTGESQEVDLSGAPQANVNTELAQARSEDLTDHAKEDPNIGYNAKASLDDTLNNDNTSKQSTQSASTEQPSAESAQEKPQEKVNNKAESRPGVTDTNVTPNELLGTDDKNLKKASFGQTKGLFSATPPGLMRANVISNEMIEANPVVRTEKKNIELSKAKSGITQAQEVLELPEISNPLSSNAQESEKISPKNGIVQGQEFLQLPEMNDAISSVTDKKNIELPKAKSGIVQGQQVVELPLELSQDVIELPIQQKVIPAASSGSYLTQAWNAMLAYPKTSLGLGLLATAATGSIAAPTIIAALTPATTALVPTLITAPLAAPIATTALTTSATTGLLSYAAGAKALMAAKTLVGLAGFAITKNPMFLLPK